MGDGKRSIPVTRLNPMRERRTKMFGAIDTETIGLNGRIVLAQLYHETWSGEARVYRRPAEMVADLFALPRKLLKDTIFYSHNAVYDWRYLIEIFVDWFDVFDFKPCERAQGSFYEIRVYSKTEKTAAGRPLLVTTFRDSMAVFGGTLHDLTASFAPAYVKQDIGLSSGVVFNPDDPIHIAYAKNDVIGLVAALIRMDEIIYEHFHVHLKGTISGTAYQGWLRAAPADVYHDRLPAAVESFVRRAYYGGNVSLHSPLNTEIIGVRGFDINSSYPAVMRSQGVPSGKPEATTGYEPGDIGFYEVAVNIPDGAILPMIPYRNETEKLAFPTGRFDTIISSAEIEHGRAMGYEIKVLFGYRFPKIIYPFTEFVDKCERLRAEYKGTPVETVVKLMQNSVYGRFGMKPTGRTVELSDVCPDGFVAVIAADTGNPIPYAFFKDEQRDTEYMIPSYAAWITASARIALDNFTTLAGRDNVRSRDTDSIKVVGAPSPEFLARITKQYGDMKDEGEKRRFMTHAPKCASWQELNKQTGEWEWKFIYKGIPAKLVTPEILAAIRRGENVTVTYNSTTGFTLYITTGEKQIERTRTTTDVRNVYSHEIDEKGWFRPRRVNSRGKG
jgi:DNA polymerase type B, organellar and viral